MNVLEPARLKGHLRVVCGVDRSGASYIREQDFSVPFHLGKSFQEKGVAVVNIVNPTAGLLRGDSTRSELTVEPGARLLVLYPSATRVYDTQDGWSEAVQEIEVKAGGWLEIFPQLFIPQRGARHRQKTSIRVEEGGELCYLEMLAPGRVASGESFAFAELDWRTDIRHRDRLIARERFRLSPEGKSLRPLLKFSPHAYTATFFIVANRLTGEDGCWKEIDGYHEKGLWIGCSRLAHAGWAIKMLGEDSHRLRQAVEKVRERIHRAADWPLPDRRKL